MCVGEADTRLHDLLNLRGLGVDVPAHPLN